MESEIFYQLSIVMVLAAGLSLLARVFRQPMIIAYIITGFIVGPSLLDVIHNHEAFETFSQIGITLLLFIIGLGLNIGVIKTTGKPVVLAFLTLLVVGAIGLAAGLGLGLSPAESIIMGTALLFSSTIIVIKALSDKKEQSRLYGQLAIGILLVDDIAATMALVAVSSISGHGGGGLNEILLLIGKGALLGAALTLVGGYIMPRLSKLFASSQELLYVFAIAWAFGVASAFNYAGFSMEVGALFAGVSLASLPYVQAIGSRLKPLRDFFLVLFFINLGEGLRLDNLSDSLVPALVFSAIVLIGKPLVILTTLGLMGYTKQTSFKTAAHVSQISEFSVILIVLAATTGLVGKDLIAIGTLTALITIAVSAYFMKYDDRLYKRFAKNLSIFERSRTKRELKALSHYPLVLIGYNEGAAGFVQTFRQMKKRYIVIDYNPDIIEVLERQHVNHLYGDATDVELLEEIGVHKSELVISTINNAETNRLLARHITRANKDAIFVCHASKLDDAEALYDAGAAYVLMPHFIGDQHINHFIKRNGSDKRAFAKYRHDHLVAMGKAVING